MNDEFTLIISNFFRFLSMKMKMILVFLIPSIAVAITIIQTAIWPMYVIYTENLLCHPIRKELAYVIGWNVRWSLIYFSCVRWTLNMFRCWMLKHLLKCGKSLIFLALLFALLLFLYFRHQNIIFFVVAIFGFPLLSLSPHIHFSVWFGCCLCIHCSLGLLICGHTHTHKFKHPPWCSFNVSQCCENIFRWHICTMQISSYFVVIVLFYVIVILFIFKLLFEMLPHCEVLLLLFSINFPFYSVSCIFFLYFLLLFFSFRMFFYDILLAGCFWNFQKSIQCMALFCIRMYSYDMAMLFSCHFACLDLLSKSQRSAYNRAECEQHSVVFLMIAFGSLFWHHFMCTFVGVMGSCCHCRFWWNVWIYDWNSFVWNENIHK